MNTAYDIICIGMALVDCIIKGFDSTPVSASGYRASSCSLSAGGEAVNEAAAAARLGLRAGILCALGEDDAGSIVESALRRSGVDTSLILRSPEHPTPVTTMFVNDDGTRKSVTNRAHIYNFRPDRCPERFSSARAVLLGSLFRAPFDDPAVIHSVLRTAKANGQLIFADTKLPNFRFLTLDDLVPSLPLIDFITPNEDEARYFTGRDTPEAMADEFLARGVKNVIVKLGSRGCLLKNAELCLALPGFPVEAADATGAGDNFIAGFASELLRGSGTEEALLFANACGAICTTAVGAGTALRDRAQVLAFLEDRRSA